MGQVIKVEAREGPDDTLYLDMDRSLTGMGLEAYYSPEDAKHDDPADELARQLFAIKGVSTVFINSNVVTLTRTPDADWGEIETQAADVIANLFIHYDVNRT